MKRRTFLGSLVAVPAAASLPALPAVAKEVALPPLEIVSRGEWVWSITPTDVGAVFRFSTLDDTGYGYVAGTTSYVEDMPTTTGGTQK